MTTECKTPPYTRTRTHTSLCRCACFEHTHPYTILTHSSVHNKATRTYIHILYSHTHIHAYRGVLLLKQADKHHVHPCIGALAAAAHGADDAVCAALPQGRTEASQSDPQGVWCARGEPRAGVCVRARTRWCASVCSLSLGCVDVDVGMEVCRRVGACVFCVRFLRVYGAWVCARLCVRFNVRRP
jgi:hypothetical protein